MDIACPQCAAAYEIDSTSVTPAGRKVRCAECTTIWRVFPAGYGPLTGAPPQEAAVAPKTPPAAEAPDAPVSLTEAAQVEQFLAGRTVDAALNGQESVAEAAAQSAAAETTLEKEAPPGRAKLTRNPKTAKPKRNPLSGLLSWQFGTIAATLVVCAGAFLQREMVVRHLPQTARLLSVIGHPVNLRGIDIRNVASRIINDGDDPVLVVDGDLVNVTDRRVDVPRLYFTVLGKDGQPVYAWSAQADRTSLQPGEKLNFRRRLAAPPADGRDVSVRFLTRSDMTAGIK
jgi:predicted Zn finger-like uncharacterized protein